MCLLKDKISGGKIDVLVTQRLEMYILARGCDHCIQSVFYLNQCKPAQAAQITIVEVYSS